MSVEKEQNTNFKYWTFPLKIKLKGEHVEKRKVSSNIKRVGEIYKKWGCPVKIGALGNYV